MQEKAPLFDKMKEYAFQRKTRWHVPGHAASEDGDPDVDLFFRQIRLIDVTEVGDMDDLHHPQGVIAEAQRLAAACFGAEETCFLVNGSTVGNQAMIASTVSAGELLLAQRNVHKSVIHGLMLTGARAVFLTPETDQATGLTTGVKPQTVEQALNAYPEAKAILLANPNYYGMSTDLREIVEIAHRHHIPLLVDEAHGAHYGFHPDVPPSALSSGADAVVQSTHKMLTALTMGAMLHLQGDLIDRSRLKRMLNVLQSSSPSYPIMASLDIARRTIAIRGQELLERICSRSDELKAWITRETSLAAVNLAGTSSYAYLDPLKITLYDRTGSRTGFQLRTAIQEQGCFSEMADDKHVLLHLGLLTKEEDVESLKMALHNISCPKLAQQQEISRDIENIYIIPPPDFQQSSPVSFHMNLGMQTVVRHVPFSKAAGHRSGAMIVPYPPGIPLLYPGEIISEHVAAYVSRLVESGAVVQGLDVEDIRNGIPVIVEDSIRRRFP